MSRPIKAFKPQQQVRLDNIPDNSGYAMTRGSVHMQMFVNGQAATIVEPLLEAGPGEAYWIEVEQPVIQGHLGHISIWSEFLGSTEELKAIEEACVCGAHKTFNAGRGSVLHNQDYCSWFASKLELP